MPDLKTVLEVIQNEQDSNNVRKHVKDALGVKSSWGPDGDRQIREAAAQRVKELEPSERARRNARATPHSPHPFLK